MGDYRHFNSHVDMQLLHVGMHKYYTRLILTMCTDWNACTMYGGLNSHSSQMKVYGHQCPMPRSSWHRISTCVASQKVIQNSTWIRTNMDVRERDNQQRLCGYCRNPGHTKATCQHLMDALKKTRR
ncbi:hypothetical protein PVK06_043248 [Gossypium arboreum]|uniref:Uncharacterized protein n=1 Tax=Gossypium arboreum TaxID=29729 RepID=A0ABR0MN15_GOSAR|nr:hypothetical protein PVK06_043248 [Gossypium arboreum]